MKIEIPILITVLGAAVTFGGFYYSTAHRLSSLEREIQEVDKRINNLTNKVNKLKKPKTNRR
jgi:cell division protein FtsL